MLFAHKDGRVGHRQLSGDEVNLISDAPHLAFSEQSVGLVFTSWLALRGDVCGSIEPWSGNPARVLRSP